MSFYRVHGNKGRAPHNRFTTEEVEMAVSFLKNYAQVHAILLPGRIPGYKATTIQLLPSSCTKTSIWLAYSTEAQKRGIKAASRTHFVTLWKQTTPEITICKPMSDLCWVCQCNSISIIRAANKPEDEKSQVKFIIASRYLENIPF